MAQLIHCKAEQIAFYIRNVPFDWMKWWKDARDFHDDVVSGFTRNC